MTEIVRTIDFDKIVQDYDLLKTDRKRAEAEGKLWSQALKSEKTELAQRIGTKIDRGRWLVEILGDQGSGPRTNNAYDLRARLSKAPSEMWDYIESSGCTLHTAVSLYKQCLEAISKNGNLTFTDALQYAIAKPKVRARATSKTHKITNNPSKQDWALLYGLVHKIVKPRITELSESDQQKLESELSAQIQAAVSSFCGKVQRYRSAELEVSDLVLRSKMETACNVLQVDVPPPGQLANLRAARKKAWKIIAQIHPDNRVSREGNDSVQDGKMTNEQLTLYQNVNNAVGDIDAYNRRIEERSASNGQ
jgi:hypothetical protein